MAAISILQNIGLFFKYGWPFIILFAIVVAKMKWKAWMIDVVILERRGKNIVKSNDRAGRYVDKFTGLTGYKLMKSKDTIPVVEFDWILHNNLKHLSIPERIVNMLRPTVGTLFLFKYGSKQYKPLLVSGKEINEKQLIAVKDKDGQDVYVSQYQQFDPRGYLNSVEMEVFDWDNMNFAVQEMRASQERRQKQSGWMKQILMPIAIIACATMISIVMMKFALDYSQTLKAGTPATTPESTAVTPGIPIIGDVLPGN